MPFYPKQIVKVTNVCSVSYHTPVKTARGLSLIHILRRAAAKGFINATDCADYLTKKGMPFRDAYKLTGCMVSVSYTHL